MRRPTPEDFDHRRDLAKHDFPPLDQKPLSETSRRILARAASRERGNVCPIVDGRVHAATQMTVLNALHRRGFITDIGIPYITETGRDYLKAPRVVGA